MLFGCPPVASCSLGLHTFIFVKNEMMELKQEMMDDTMDDVMGEEGEEAETEEVVNQVLDELGLSLNGQLVSAPSGQDALSEPAKVGAADDELQVRDVH